MQKVVSKFSKVGFRFDNTYVDLPQTMLTRLHPVPVSVPKLLIFNKALSDDLGLDLSSFDNNQVASIFAGNLLPRGSQYLSQAYAGHQFGYFTMLGDGRAALMGEHLTLKNKRFDVQLKGSGQTPYSRGGDGRAALGPVLREYVISEAMNALGVPSTRSLAVVTTGENVIRDTPLPGAILTRIASSHIRVGTFQYLLIKKDKGALQKFVNYTINRHYPSVKNTKLPAISFLEKVMKKQIELVVSWMRVGFIHGVMNTDNMSISGETIDYGPCAFMDAYNPKTVFSSIDYYGRYAYNNQPSIVHWNLLRFAETLLPIIHDDQKRAVKMVSEILDAFGDIYKKRWLNMMRNKLGLFNKKNEDEKLISDLLSLMQKNNYDYTNTFNFLGKKNFSKESFFNKKESLDWYGGWRKRLLENNKPLKKSLNLMHLSNPAIIPRNYKVEEVLKAASVDGNMSPINNFIEVLKTPYRVGPKTKTFQFPPSPSDIVYKTFCGT